MHHPTVFHELLRRNDEAGKPGHVYPRLGGCHNIVHQVFGLDRLQDMYLGQRCLERHCLGILPPLRISHSTLEWNSHPLDKLRLQRSPIGHIQSRLHIDERIFEKRHAILPYGPFVSSRLLVVPVN